MTGRSSRVARRIPSVIPGLYDRASSERQDSRDRSRPMRQVPAQSSPGRKNEESSDLEHDPVGPGRSGHGPAGGGNNERGSGRGGPGGRDGPPGPTEPGEDKAAEKPTEPNATGRT